MNKIEILSPGKGCKRTQKIINWVKNILDKNKIKYKLEIITEQKRFTDYQTWILPTLIVNGRIVARGYKPLERKLFEALNHEN